MILKSMKKKKDKGHAHTETNILNGHASLADNCGPCCNGSSSRKKVTSQIKHCEEEPHCEDKNTFSDASQEEEVAKRLAGLDLQQHQQPTDEVEYAVYVNELQMPDIMRLIQKDLSEPYSIYTYRYFIHNWPHLCFMARVNNECVGAIVCKLDYHKKIVKRGYIAMLAVDAGHRKKRIGSTLVKRAIEAMVAQDADEVVLETEITNKPALRLYENLGFVRDKRLFRYYLNGVDALRLKLWLR